jgi:aromatic ring-cleaving dioxygenase
MEQAFADAARIEGYHAHIYYAPHTRAEAEQIREGIGARFQALLGRWHDEAVGPHPISMYQVAFSAAEFPRIVPWLMLNRGELSILVHPLSGDAYLDHAKYALWLGTPVELRLEVLRRLVESRTP